MTEPVNQPTASQKIIDQLRKVQIELKAPKNEDGRFGKSRSAEAILEAAKPVLEKHDLTLVITDDIVEVGGRHYVRATATVYNGEASVSATAHAWEGDIDRGLDAAQITGKASSYARKYAMGGLFAIDDTKDADHDAESSNSAPIPIKATSASEVAQAIRDARPTAEASATDAMRTGPQLKKLMALFKEAGYEDRDNRLEYCEWAIGHKVASANELTKDEAGKVIEALELDIVNASAEAQS